jgi:hypothetical protein
VEARARVVPQLLYIEATAAEWLFPQEKATLLDAREGTYFVEPLQGNVRTLPMAGQP